jgi:hypothetical protein
MQQMFAFQQIKHRLEKIISKHKTRIKFLIYSNKRPLKCSAYLKSISRDYVSGKCNLKLQFTHFKCGRTYKVNAFVPFKNIRFIRDNLILKEISEDNILLKYFANHFEEKQEEEPVCLTKFSFI